MLLQFLPWYQSRITEYTLGFPTFFLYYFCSFLTVAESLILTIIFALFAIEEQGLFSESKEQQLLFFLSIFFTFFLGTATIIESLFVGKAEEQERITNRSNQLEMSNIENPISEYERKQLAKINELQQEMEKIKHSILSEKSEN